MLSNTQNADFELNVILQEEGLSDGSKIFVAYCDDLDIASQGETPDEAQANFVEAVDLWLGTASQTEIEAKLFVVRRRKPIILKRIPVHYGQTAGVIGQ